MTKKRKSLVGWTGKYLWKYFRHNEYGSVTVPVLVRKKDGYFSKKVRLTLEEIDG
jgi:hypothetical protein